MSLTHSQLKKQPAWVREHAALMGHVSHLMAGMPGTWVDKVSREWSERRAVNAQDSARWGFGLVRKLRRGEVEGVRIGDGDAEVCNKAKGSARRVADMLAAIKVRVIAARQEAPADHVARLVLRLQAFWARADFARRGLLDKLPAGKRISRAGILARISSQEFWRRVLRVAQAVSLETAAIDLGMVKAGQSSCYVSAESLKRRRGQVIRNAATLAGTLAVNEHGQAMTLADVAARGVADKAVRRAELMTRISGFEVIAHELGHPADFITVTCPSRFHKWRRGDRDRSTANPLYKGATPADGQAHLAKAWALFRVKAARRGLKLYGFRIAEPHHDGCPHWHMLMWYEPRCTPAMGKRDKARIRAGTMTPYQADAAATLRALLDEFFLLADSPTERGAAEYRVKVERIDPAKGSAVAYVAKYVAKNIDGYKVGADLYGQPALESSARVEAWAATWRIRQFQQIGGAPVGVWRELRRVHPGALPADAGQALADALVMVNVSALDAVMAGTDRHQGDARTMTPAHAADADSQAIKAHAIRKGWAAYVMGQGGPTAKRKAQPMRVLRQDTGEVGRYGDPMGPVVAGVVCTSVEFISYGIITRHAVQRVDAVESERCHWMTATMGQDAGARDRVALRLGAVFADQEASKAAALRENRRQAHRMSRDDAGQVLGAVARGEALRPWTRVNNCTQLTESPFRRVIHTHKRGQIFRWGGGRNTGKNHERRTEDPGDHP